MPKSDDVQLAHAQAWMPKVGRRISPRMDVSRAMQEHVAEDAKAEMCTLEQRMELVAEMPKSDYV